MKETFYHQIREFGIMLERANYSEIWMVKGCSIIIRFNDLEHKQISNITL